MRCQRKRHEARNVLSKPAPGHDAKAQKAAGPDTFHYKPPVSLLDSMDWYASRRLVLNHVKLTHYHHATANNFMRRESFFETHAMPSYHTIMRFHRKALGLKHLIKAGPLPLPSCHGMESRGAREDFIKSHHPSPHNGIGVGPEEN